MAVFTPTDRPKSVRNPYVIEVLVAFFLLSGCFYDFSVDEGAFVVGLSNNLTNYKKRLLPRCIHHFISDFI